MENSEDKPESFNIADHAYFDTIYWRPVLPEYAREIAAFLSAPVDTPPENDFMDDKAKDPYGTLGLSVAKGNSLFSESAPVQNDFLIIDSSCDGLAQFGTQPSFDYYYDEQSDFELFQNQYENNVTVKDHKNMGNLGSQQGEKKGKAGTGKESKTEGSKSPGKFRLNKDAKKVATPPVRQIKLETPPPTTQQKRPPEIIKETSPSPESSVSSSHYQDTLSHLATPDENSHSSYVQNSVVQTAQIESQSAAEDEFILKEPCLGSLSDITVFLDDVRKGECSTPLSQKSFSSRRTTTQSCPATPESVIDQLSFNLPSRIRSVSDVVESDKNRNLGPYGSQEQLCETPTKSTDGTSSSAPTFTLTQHRKVILAPHKFSTPSSSARHTNSEDCLRPLHSAPNTEPRSSVRRHSSYGDVPPLDGNVLRKVASLTLDKATIESKVNRPKVVPEKLDFSLYEKFEGQMLLNWFSTGFPDNHYLRAVLSKQDLKLAAAQFCTHLLAAGVLQQIEDENAPLEVLFRPDLMYYWTHSEMQPSSSTIPGRLSLTAWPPPLSDDQKVGLRQTEAEIQNFIKCLPEEQRETLEKLQKNQDEAFHQARVEQYSKMRELQFRITCLEREIEKYQTLADIEELTRRARSDQGASFKEETQIADVDVQTETVVLKSNASQTETVVLKSNTSQTELVATKTFLSLGTQTGLPSSSVFYSVGTQTEKGAEGFLSSQSAPGTSSLQTPADTDSIEPPLPAPSKAPTTCMTAPPPPPPPPMPGMDIPPPPPMPSLGIPLPPPMPGMGIPPPPPMPGMGIPPPPPMPGMGIPPPPPMPGMGIPPPPPMPGMGIPPPPPFPGMGPPPPPPFPGMGVPPPPPPPGIPGAPGMFAPGPPPIPTARKPALNPIAPMKPLYWTRIQFLTPQPVSPSGTLWDSLEENIPDSWEEFASLFSRQAPGKKMVKEKPKNKEVAKLLDQKRSQNVGILISSLKVDISDVENAVYNFDTSVLDLEKLQKIYEARPVPDELDTIKKHLEMKKDIPLDKPEQFLYDLAQIPDYEKRVYCIMFRDTFAESISVVENKLNNLKIICEFLRNGESTLQLFGIILGLGNYMNGGNRSRGQADGFGLEILSKLRDVKSKDNSMTLLHYIVRTYIQLYQKEDTMETAKLPVLEPSDLEKASLVNFDDMSADLKKLHTQISDCQKKVEMVISSSDEEHMQPFKEKMEEFLQKAFADHREEEDHLEECEKSFLSLKEFFKWNAKSNNQAEWPKEFFVHWITFSSDFKDIWKKEMQRKIKADIENARKKSAEILASSSFSVKDAVPVKKTSGLKSTLKRRGLVSSVSNAGPASPNPDSTDDTK